MSGLADKVPRGHLHADVPISLPSELVTVLAEGPSAGGPVRIERIVSWGQPALGS